MNGKLSAWLKKEIKLPGLRPRQKRPPPPWVRWMSKVFTWLLCLLLLWFAVWRVLLYREIDHRFTAIRAAGLPTSGQELNVWRLQVPDSENGALILTQAFVLTRTFPDSRSNLVIAPELLKRTNQWSVEIYEMVSEYVLTNAAAIAKAREAARFQQFRFSADFSYALETELPHLGHLKNLARIVALQSALAAEAGHVDEWPDQAVLLLNLASTIDEEPTIISHLVRNAIVRMAVTVTERGINRAVPGNEVCKKLQDAFTRVGKTNLLARALIGERAMDIPIFRLSWSEIQNFNQNGEGENQPRKPQHYSGKPQFIFWLSGFFERDLNFYLQTMEKATSLAKLPPPENLVLTNAMEDASQVARKKSYFYSALLMPAFASVASREASTQAQVELAQVAMAVARFHNTRGAWPENLKVLVPQFLDFVPVDPFDGAPMRYHLLNKGWVIYSVDADGHDDGGRESPDHKKSTDTNSYDITFTVER
jgi:hypothetical protein